MFQAYTRAYGVLAYSMLLHSFQTKGASSPVNGQSVKLLGTEQHSVKVQEAPSKVKHIGAGSTLDCMLESPLTPKRLLNGTKLSGGANVLAQTWQRPLAPCSRSPILTQSPSHN
eukprot:6016732-Pleurochrysis_carterae.AAC.2